MKNVLLLMIALLLIVAVHTQANTPQGDGTLRRIRLPILMYHYVETLPPNADNIRRGLTVSPELFEQHLGYLQQHGYETVNSEQVYHALTVGAPLPPKPIMLTFDDGYDTHYSIVFPLLRQYGMIGTFYVITSALDHQRSGHMTWPQAVEMAQAGMEIAAHTKNHVELRGRTHDQLVYEVIGSIESITAYAGQRPFGFAYPVGRYDRNTLRFMATVGPIVATTTQNGLYISTDTMLTAPRLRITQNVTPYALGRMLNG